MTSNEETHTHLELKTLPNELRLDVAEGLNTRGARTTTAELR